MKAKIEGCKNGILKGWAWDPASSDTPVIMHLLIDNTLQGTVKADNFRGDLVRAKLGKGTHGFEFIIPQEFRDGRLHRVTLKSLDGRPIRVSGLVDVEFGIERQSIQSRIEKQDEKMIRGWVWDRANPSAKLELELVAGEVVIATTLASQYRPDLARHFIGDGRHGFEFVLEKLVVPSTSNLKIRTLPDVGGIVIGELSITSTLASNGINYLNMPDVDQELAKIKTAAETPVLTSIFDPVEATSAPPNSVVEVIDTGSAKNRAASAPLESIHSFSAATKHAEIGSVVVPAMSKNSSVYEENLQRALRRIRAAPNSIGLYLDAKSKADLGAAEITTSDHHLRIRLQSLQGWMRILSKPIPLSDISSTDYQIRFSISALDGPFQIRAVSLCHFDPASGFRLVQRLAKDINVGFDTEEVTLTLRSTAARQLNHDQKENLPFFVFAEVDSVCGFEISNICFELVEKDPNEAPFRNSTLPLCNRLADLNGALSIVGRKNPVSWVVDQAEIALRFECFNTAARLVKNLVLSDIKKDDPLNARIVRLCAEVYLAEGRIDELRDLLLSRPDLVGSDDVLATALSTCFPGDVALISLFGRLPSGKLNRAYVARTALSGEVLRSAFFETAGEQGDQHEIFVANILRKVSSGAYLSWWNKYLSRQGLSEIGEINLGAQNVLETLEFRRSERRSSAHLSKISIVMSAYNSGSSVSYAIRSILQQTHENVELLICDDCSSDNTLSEILKWKQDERVRVFRSIKNQGPYNIRNALIAEARGEHLTFQDADDFAHPERLERQLEALAGNSSQSVIGRWVRVRPDGEVVFFRDQRCLRMSVVSLMAKTSLFREHGLYRNVLCGGDSEFLERLRVRFGKDALTEIDLPLIFGLWSERSLTRQDGLEATEDGFRSKARRDYAEISSRQRLLGPAVITDHEINLVNQANGIFREFAGAVEL